MGGGWGCVYSTPSNNTAKWYYEWYNGSSKHAGKEISQNKLSSEVQYGFIYMNGCLTFEAIYTFNITSWINQVNNCEVCCKLESLEGNKADQFMNLLFLH